MRAIKRRRVLQVLGATPAVAAFAFTESEAALVTQQAQTARRRATAAGTAFKPRFFTAAEYAVVTTLADMIIPKDERSGSASDAGVPEFVDYFVHAQEERRVAMRGGLVWLDTECRRRFDKAFMGCSDAERRQVLDDIAYPAKADKRFSHGVRFFTSLRDLVAGGFWSSKVGMADIGYQGNVPVGEWTGAPQNVLDKVGVKYE
jgi:gluconate 2-dehydrogenase gamma chain